jgi:hypothetical protein
VARLNQLLLLPPNRQSRQAQALIGDAWLGAGDTRRARVEYDLYLKLYPNGDDAPRVAAALTAAGGSPPKASAGGVEAAPAAQAKAQPEQTLYSGSISQYFNAGKARTLSLVTLSPGIDQTTLSRTTESSVVTSLDLSARFTSEASDIRAVVRGSGHTELGGGSRASSLLSAAYVDYKHNASGLAVRGGRQSAISGGLLGLFDGVSLSYPLRSGIKIDVMGGVPANTLVSSPSQRLLAAMLEFDGVVDKWGGNVYVVDQTSEGYTNRRGLGVEVRYADETWSGYTLLDYDLELRALNAVTLQGSFQAPGQTTVTLLVDDRRAPGLALNNALISTGRATLHDLFSQPLDPLVSTALPTLAEVRAIALKTSAKAQQAMVSVSRPFGEHWQASADLRYSQVGALPEVGLFDATPATGAQYTASLQVTGTNLYSARDINSFNLSALSAPTFKGLQLSYSNLTGLLNNDVTLEPSMRLYFQHGSAGDKVQRYAPGLRVTWRMSKRASLLGEALVERSTSEGPNGSGSSTASSFYLGYRYELF